MLKLVALYMRKIRNNRDERIQAKVIIIHSQWNRKQ